MSLHKTLPVGYIQTVHRIVELGKDWDYADDHQLDTSRIGRDITHYQENLKHIPDATKLLEVLGHYGSTHPIGTLKIKFIRLSLFQPMQIEQADFELLIEACVEHEVLHDAANLALIKNAVVIYEA